MSDLTRRIDIQRMTPAEMAITKAMEAVEALPPDVRVTEAVVLLGKARDHVADYVDSSWTLAHPGDHKGVDFDGIGLTFSAHPGPFHTCQKCIEANDAHRRLMRGNP